MKKSEEFKNVKNPKILILGYGEHGKNEVADIISDFTGFRSKSTSEAAFEIIFPLFSLHTGIKDPIEAYHQRRNYRDFIDRTIQLINYEDKGTLGRLILNKYDIVVGVRKQEEYQAIQDKVNYVFWVDASTRVKSSDNTMTIEYNPDTMYKIDNNASKGQLKLNTLDLLVKLNII